jgi:hypothetical protein
LGILETAVDREEIDMKCKCGNKLTEGARFCGQCGASIPEGWEDDGKEEESEETEWHTAGIFWTEEDEERLKAEAKLWADIKAKKMKLKEEEEARRKNRGDGEKPE